MSDKPTKCDNCGHEWNYSGKYSSRTTCPDCQRKTTIGVSDEQELENDELAEELEA